MGFLPRRNDGMKETRMRVPDMSCGHCEASIRGALEGLEGVESVDVSLETKTVVVRSIEELGAEDLMGAVSSVGFSPETV
jgi:copper chaperone CopZ